MQNKLKQKVDQDTKDKILEGGNHRLSVLKFDESSGTKWYLNSINKVANELGIEILDHLEDNTPVLLLKPYDTYTKKQLHSYNTLKSGLSHKDIEGKIQTPTIKAVLDMVTTLCPMYDGVDITLFGRSKELGLPLANKLINRGYTVTVCNSNTKLKPHLFQSTILIDMAGINNEFEPDATPIHWIDVVGQGKGIKIGQLTTSYLMNQVANWEDR